MANNKSALKRILIAERNRLRNKAYKSAVKTLMKKCYQAMDDYVADPSSTSLETAQEAMSSAYSKIDKAVKRRVFHRNNGARKKANLAKALKKVTLAS